jgi:hypothetical protein
MITDFSQIGGRIEGGVRTPSGGHQRDDRHDGEPDSNAVAMRFVTSEIGLLDASRFTVAVAPLTRGAATASVSRRHNTTEGSS